MVMCRACGCEVRELERCGRCRITAATICECCLKILPVQTHTHAAARG